MFFAIAKVSPNSSHRHSSNMESPFSKVIGLLKGNKRLWWLIIPATTFCLGTWQVLRLQWKLQEVEELEKRTMLPAMEMPSE